MSRPGRPRNLAKPARPSNGASPAIQSRCSALGIPSTVSPDHPLDVLLAQRLITPEQHRAGGLLIAMGRSLRPNGLARLLFGGTTSPSTQSDPGQSERSARQIGDALRSESRHVRDALENATWRNRLPKACITRDARDADLKALRRGLDAVARVMGLVL